MYEQWCIFKRFGSVAQNLKLTERFKALFSLQKSKQFVNICSSRYHSGENQALFKKNDSIMQRFKNYDSKSN